MTRRIWHRSLATFLRIGCLLIILATDKSLISHRMFYGNLCSRQASSNVWQLLLVRLRLWTHFMAGCPRFFYHFYGIRALLISVCRPSTTILASRNTFASGMLDYVFSLRVHKGSSGTKPAYYKSNYINKPTWSTDAFLLKIVTLGEQEIFGLGRSIF